MPRPKGSKNKTVDQPKEFDYERDDPFIDGAYQTSADTMATIMPGSDSTTSTENPTAIRPRRSSLLNPLMNYQPTETFAVYLVEGDVQLSSRELGRGSMVAKQTRLVRATSDLQAVSKFSAYFASLSDDESVYTVVRAAAMETIN